MNPMTILFVAVALASASMLTAAAPAEQSSQCELQSEKPVLDNQSVKEWDDFDTRFSKMFRGYVQKEVEGTTMYLPLNLTDTSARGTGESLTDLSESQYWDYTLNAGCATINVGVTKLRPDVEIVYRPHGMTYTVGDSTESCWFKMIEPKEDGTHAYSCNVKVEGSEEIKQVATLVIQRMDLDKFLSTRLPKKYDISWR